MKKLASKVAKPAQIQPKSQFLFHKNLPLRDFSIMTLTAGLQSIDCESTIPFPLSNCAEDNKDGAASK